MRKLKRYIVLHSMTGLPIAQIKAINDIEAARVLVFTWQENAHNLMFRNVNQEV